jgi:hypothetical protein
MSPDGTTAEDRTAEAVALARDATAMAGEVGALTVAVAEWADWALAGGAPPRYVARQMITAGRLIAAAARGEAAAL